MLGLPVLADNERKLSKKNYYKFNSYRLFNSSSLKPVALNFVNISAVLRLYCLLFKFKTSGCSYLIFPSIIVIILRVDGNC
jgi:hypothetical protein